MWGSYFSKNECIHTFFIHPSQHISLSIDNHTFLYKRERDHLEKGLVCFHFLSLSFTLWFSKGSYHFRDTFGESSQGHPHTYSRNHFRCSITLLRNPHGHSWGTRFRCSTLFRGTLLGTLLKNHLRCSTTLLRNYLMDTLEEPSQVLHYSPEELP